MDIDCSVIVLNYNGEKIIRQVVDSLEAMDYPKNRFEVIIVDNHSRDKSKGIIEKYARIYPNIITIFLNDNLGFSRGNNQGIKKARGKYICLLNNDCIVDRYWLKKLIEVAKQDKKIFAVNSKILLYPKFLSLNLVLSSDISLIYALLLSSKIFSLNKTKKMLIKFTKTEKGYNLELPYDQHDNDIELEMVFNDNSPTNRVKGSLEKLIRINIKDLKPKITIRADGEIKYRVKIPTDLKVIRDNSYDKIQNAGIVVFQDGYGRDIGSIVRYKQQFYEYDTGQYDTQKEIYAACGAAVLYRKSTLDKIGYLDESFFMYYEDVELSERARINGYKVVYSPESVVRHVHTLSSQEWSPFFVYHVEKGRLLHIFYYFPLRVFFYEYLLMIGLLFFNLINFTFKLRLLIFGLMVDQQKKSHSEFSKKIQHLKVILFFILFLVPLWIHRKSILSKIRYSTIDLNYHQILTGRWYFL